MPTKREEKALMLWLTGCVRVSRMQGQQCKSSEFEIVGWRLLLRCCLSMFRPCLPSVLGRLDLKPGSLLIHSSHRHRYTWK
uniref:Uncharacterized protein n=1 Tax=Arundo donax TaxID=35708 RepID=A0A0A9E0G2_ARUDO